MSIEIYQQWDMFTGEQVEVGKSRSHPLYQAALFSPREMVEMGANARPWLNDIPAPTLELECQDTRTEEQKEQDLQRAAEALTQSMFAERPAPPTSQVEERVQAMDEPIPVAWVSKNTLVGCRPDLKERIQDLNTADMVLVAKRVREVLETTYQMALDVTLTEYLDVGETPDDG